MRRVYFMIGLLLLAYMIPCVPTGTVQADTAWWNTSWSYRKEFTIEGSSAGAQTDYQMKLIIHKGNGTDSGNDVYLSDHCNDNFSDIRFTKADGETKLDYWIEEYTSGDNATVWIEFDSIPASPDSATFYLYYGNPEATSESNGNNTFNFFDHFDGASVDTDKWTVAGTVSLADSIATIGSGGADAYLLGKSSFATNYRFRSKAKYLYNNKKAVIGFELNLNRWASYYSSIVAGQQTAVTSNDTGTQEHTGLGDILEDTWAVYEVIRNSTTNVLFYIDDVPKATHATYIPTVAHYPFLRGETETLWADWIFISKYVSPEPTWGSWGVEESTIKNDLVVNITGVGNISVNGTTPSSYPNTTKWVVNTTITINATPDPCWKFVNWTGDTGTIEDVNASNTTINMTDNYSIVANFVQVLDVETLNATNVGVNFATLNGNITEAECEVLERGFEWYTSYTAWGLPEDLYDPNSWDYDAPFGGDEGEGPIVWGSQSFTPLITHNVTGIGIRGGQMASTPSPGNVTISIREADENQTPIGDDLCSVTFNGNDTEPYYDVYPHGGAWYIWNVFPEITLYAGGNYAIVVHTPEANNSHKFAWNLMAWDGHGVYPNQSALYSVDGISWNNSGVDLASGIFSEGLWNEWTEEGSFATGEFNHTITDLTCNATYYYRAMARDSIGWVYGDWVSFTTMSCPSAPLNFTVTQIGTSAALLNWTNYPGTQYTIIRTSTDGYPNLTTGYLIFNNTTTNYTDTGLNLEQTTYYYTAWGYNPDVYSSDTAKGKIGGDAMLLVGLIILGLGLTAYGLFRKSMVWLVAAALPWMALSFWQRLESSGWWSMDIHEILFYIGLALFLVCLLEALSLRPLQEAPSKPKSLLDEGIEEMERTQDELDRLGRRGKYARPT